MKDLDRKTHWDNAWASRPSDALSWHQPDPARSLVMIRQAGVGPGDSVIDVGAGDSVLCERLLDQGFTDLTVLDLSRTALDRARQRLGRRSDRLHWIEDDVTRFAPQRRYALWHDRAVFHFLVSREDRARYAQAMDRALSQDGQAVIATFALDGPQRCSGLPVVRYDAKAMAAALGKGWQVVDTCREAHTTPGGAEQNFSFFRIARTPRDHTGSRRDPQRG